MVLLSNMIILTRDEVDGMIRYIYDVKGKLAYLAKLLRDYPRKVGRCKCSYAHGHVINLIDG
jgi:hypothetical protein